MFNACVVYSFSPKLERAWLKKTKKKISFIIVLVCSYLIINKYTSIDTDPCDIKCDNCINAIQCEECYNDCYSKLN